MGLTVFISYGREDEPVATRLKSDLETHGYECWFDKDSLVPGVNWRLEVERAIQGCDFFVLLMSSRSISKRGFVQKEVRLALAVLDELPPSSVFIIPVRVDDCSPDHSALRDAHWINLFPSYKDGLDAIRRTLRTRSQEAAALQVELEHSAIATSTEKALSSKPAEPLEITGLGRFVRTVVYFFVHGPSRFFRQKRANPNLFLEPFRFGGICIALSAVAREAGNDLLRQFYGADGPLTRLLFPTINLNLPLRSSLAAVGQIFGLTLVSGIAWISFKLLKQHARLESIATGLMYSTASNIATSVFVPVVALTVLAMSSFLAQDSKDSIVIFTVIGQLGLDLFVCGAYALTAIAASCNVSKGKAVLAAATGLLILFLSTTLSAVLIAAVVLVLRTALAQGR